MKSLLAWKLVGAGCAALALSLALADRAAGVEQVREFIEKLKERDLHEYALEYMERMKDSPLAPEDFKQNYLLEYGTLLVDAARRTEDPKLKEQYFSDAREKLDEYSKSRVGTLEGTQAQGELANLLLERGRVTVVKANLGSQQANKEALLDEARQMFDQAHQAFQDVDAFYTSELKTFPAAIDQKKEAQKFEARQKFRAELVSTKLFTARAVYEKAKTYDPTTEEGKKLLTQAADQYGELYEKYRTWMGGLYARLFQGRCHQELGDYKQAVAYYEDLLGQDASIAALRPVIAEAYVQLSECLMVQKKYDELITKCTPWVNGARGAEAGHPHFVAVRFQLALAHHAKAESLPDKDPMKRRHVDEARKLATDISRRRGEFQKPAQELLAKLGRAPASDGVAKTFDDAFDAGKSSVEMMVAKKALLDGGQIDKSDTEQVEKTKQEIVDAREEAVKSFRLALSLVEEETGIEKVNLVRYYLCFLHWEMNRYLDAAVFGQFLAQRYPDSAGARQGAKIAMAAYLQLYNDPDNLDKDYESGKLIEVAEYIVKRWPGGPEADDAYNMLISFMVQQRKVVKAQEYLTSLSADYAGRGKAELRVGQALWAEYIRGMKLPDEERPPQAQLDEMKQKAQQTLEDGVQRMRDSGELSDTLANAVLSLAQIYLDTGQYDKGVETLEDEQFGPLTLIEAKSDVAMRAGYPESAYKAALRAYVTINPPELAKAENVMDALEGLVGTGGDAEAQERLTLIFISLGLQLQDQIQAYRGEGKQDEIDALAKSFEVFLDRIGKRQTGNTWASRNWVASTFYNLGTGFDDGKRVSPRGKEYYSKAVSAYDTILKEVAANRLQAPSENSILSVQMRMSECERKLGKYADALNRLADILEKKPMMLEAQIAAAYTYQQRGLEEKPSWFRYAYMGGREDPKTKKNRIWGWSRLAQVTAPHQQYRDVFHEARYNQALCRHEYGKTLETASEQQKYFNYAKNDIRYTAKLYPDLGGDLWRERYDRLLRLIQRSLNEKVVGLQAFQDEAAPAPSTQAKR